jgi:acid phosphatase type 7
MLGLLFVVIGWARGMIFPSQVHIAWTERANQMRVTWHARFSSTGELYYRPVLCDDAADWSYVAATTEEFDSASQTKRLGFIHSAVIENLDPACTYEYAVANGRLWSQRYFFKGATHGVKSHETYSLIVYGDLGIYDIAFNTFNLYRRMAEVQEILAIVHLGDIGYNLDSSEGMVGDKFLDMVEPVAASHAYFTVPGNHERFDNFTSYSHRFKMPVNAENQGTGYFYSLDIGPVHYVFLNSNAYLYYDKQAERKAMNEWLQADLQNATENRASVPWIVTFHHHPLYCSHDPENDELTTDCEVETAILRHSLEEIYYKHKVDLVIAGHLHHYERQSAIYQNKTVPCETEDEHTCINAAAPVHIISGSGGNRLKKNDDISKNPCLWSRFQSMDYGFGKLSVVNRTTLFWQQYSSESTMLIDYFYLGKTL